MEIDLPLVARAKALFMLKDWTKSRGALLEATVADSLDIPRYDFETMELIEPFTTWLASDVDVRHEPGDRWSVGEGDKKQLPLPFGPNIEPQVASTGGRKGRTQATMSLIPVSARIEEAKVHGFALSKYPDAAVGAPNWTLGVPFSWFADALERHLVSWESGRSNDEESGLSNLAHVRWMAGALIELERKVNAGELPRELDDRSHQ